MENTFKSIKVFIKNLPETISETIVWLVVSYLVPILNVGIIWGMQRENFELDIAIIGIVIATNACFYTSLYYLAFLNKKKRKFISIINITAFTTTVVLFAISIIEIEIEQSLFSLALYKVTTIISFVLAVILALISKYDEVEAVSKERAKLGKQTSQTNVAGKDIKI